MIRIWVGTYDGTNIYNDISDKEYDELLRQGFTNDEITEMYKLRDWQSDC